MRRLVFGLLIGIVALASAFTPKLFGSKQASLYWYQVNTGAGGNATYNNSTASFISGPSMTAPAGTNCTSDVTNKCVIGLTSTQINTTTHSINSSQTPAAVGRTRLAL